MASDLSVVKTRLGVGLLALAAALGAGRVAASEIERPETYRILASQAPGLNPEVLEAALLASRCARQQSLASRNVLAVIDYSLQSTERRLWVFDLEEKKMLFHELVAHGVNTGENRATRFSNIEGSRQSSLGLFVTGQTYMGRNGYSLKLQGLETSVNDNALGRTIVMHGAWYVSEAFHRKHGRLGRSWGCPAVRKEVARPLIDAIKNGSLLFIYYPEDRWLANSRFLNGCDLSAPVSEGSMAAGSSLEESGEVDGRVARVSYRR